MKNPNRKRRTSRLIGAIAVAAMAFGFAPFSPISPAGASDGNLCPADGQRNAFNDDNGNVHENNINCGEALDIINGKTATTFDPDGDLTRGQAASLLVQLVEAANCGTQLTVGTDQFPDDAGSVHERNINKAANNDILEGFNDGTFRPGIAVTRGQFASIVVQAVEETIGRQLTTDGQNDFDDDNDSVHESNIEKAVDNNLLEGFGGRRFAPQDDIDRDQAATILIRTAEFLFDLEFFHCDDDPAPGAATALTLTPETDINPVGSSHTVTANLTDADGDASTDGELVRFELFRDSQGGAGGGTLFFAGASTDTSTGGTADFTFGGTTADNFGDQNDLFVIVACVVETQAERCVNGDTLQRDLRTGEFNNINDGVNDTARKEFTQRRAQALSLTPETDINPTGEPHTVTATVTDQFGDASRGQEVRFELFVDTDFDGNFTEVVRSGNAGTAGPGTGVTFQTQSDTVTGGGSTQTGTVGSPNGPGTATFTFTSSFGGLFRVVACTDANNDDDCASISNVGNPGPTGRIVLDPGEVAIDTADKEFVTMQTASASVNRDETGRLTQDADLLGVNVFTNDNEFVRFVFDTAQQDRFFVNGVETDRLTFVAAADAGDAITVEFRPVDPERSVFRVTT